MYGDALDGTGSPSSNGIVPPVPVLPNHLPLPRVIPVGPMAPSTEWSCIVLCTLTSVSSGYDVMDVDIWLMATGNATSQIGARKVKIFGRAADP